MLKNAEVSPRDLLWNFSMDEKNTHLVSALGAVGVIYRTNQFNFMFIVRKMILRKQEMEID